MGLPSLPPCRRSQVPHGEASGLGSDLPAQWAMGLVLAAEALGGLELPTNVNRTLRRIRYTETVDDEGPGM